MDRKTVHESEAELMSAADLWDGAQRLADVLQRNAAKGDPVVRLEVPLSAYLAALNELNRDELVILRQQIEQRLAGPWPLGWPG